MNVAGAVLVLCGALVVAAGIIAYPRLRLLVRAPARLNEGERARLLALLPWRGLLDARQLEHGRQDIAQLNQSLNPSTPIRTMFLNVLFLSPFFTP